MAKRTRRTLPSPEALLDALGGSLELWAHQCHAASLRLVKSGVFGDTFTRVARGWTRGVLGQHSWVVVGRDCYDPEATLIDPTLWSYVPEVEGIWIGTRGVHEHTPHGMGSIWEWGKPYAGNGPTIKLDPQVPLSFGAERFLARLGPLDYHGWAMLAHAPVEGWYAGEIYAAMQATEALRAIVPIDRLGMLTELNPGGLYLAEPPVPTP